MAARKKQGTRSSGEIEHEPAAEPRVRPAAGAAAPSAFRKWLLAVAIVFEMCWIAALAAMALVE